MSDSGGLCDRCNTNYIENGHGIYVNDDNDRICDICYMQMKEED